MKKFFLNLLYLVGLHVVGIYGYSITFFVTESLRHGAVDWIVLMITVPAPVLNWPYTDLYYDCVQAWNVPKIYLTRAIFDVASYMIPIAFVVGLRYFLRHRRAEKKPADLKCRKCGYDLRATPERCPECGTISEFRRPFLPYRVPPRARG